MVNTVSAISVKLHEYIYVQQGGGHLPPRTDAQNVPVDGDSLIRNLAVMLM